MQVGYMNLADMLYYIHGEMLAQNAPVTLEQIYDIIMFQNDYIRGVLDHAEEKTSYGGNDLRRAEPEN